MPPLTIQPRIVPSGFDFPLPIGAPLDLTVSPAVPLWEPTCWPLVAGFEGGSATLSRVGSPNLSYAHARNAAPDLSASESGSDRAEFNPIAPGPVEIGSIGVQAFLIPIASKILSDIEAYLVSPEFSAAGLDHQMRAFVLVAEHAYSAAALQRLIDDTLLKYLPRMLVQASHFDAIAGVFAYVRSVRASDTLRDFVFAQCEAFFAKDGLAKDKSSAPVQDSIKKFWGEGVEISDPAAFLHSVCGIVTDKTRFGEKTLRPSRGQNTADRFRVACQHRINRDFMKTRHDVLRILHGEKFRDDAKAWDKFSGLLPYLQNGVLDESARQEYVDSFRAVLNEQARLDPALTARLFAKWLKSTNGAYSDLLARSVARHLAGAELTPHVLAVLISQDAIYTRQEDGAVADGPFIPFFNAESQKWDRLDETQRKVAYKDFYQHLYLSWIETTNLSDGFTLPAALSPRRGDRIVVEAASLIDKILLKALKEAAQRNDKKSVDFGTIGTRGSFDVAVASRMQDFLHILSDHGWTKNVSDVIRLIDEIMAEDRFNEVPLMLLAGLSTWLNRFGFERGDILTFKNSKLRPRMEGSFNANLVRLFSDRKLPPYVRMDEVFWSLLRDRDRLATLGQEFIKDPSRGITAMGALADMMRVVLPDYFSGLIANTDRDSRNNKNIFYSRRIWNEKNVPSVRDELKESISESGPLLRKFLQNYLDHMASPELKSYLDDVYENLPTFEWSHYKHGLEALVGAGFEQAFPRFDKPMKAGTVAQTHFAAYRDRDGDVGEVVIKLRRPNYFTEVDAEKSVLADKFKPYAFGPKLLDRVVEITKREGDFRNEARGMLELRALYKYARVVRPIVFSEDILIMEKAGGESLRDWHNKADETPTAIKGRYEALSKMFEEWLDSALFAEDGAFHGDPHAGNLFYDPANVRPFQYIDFGNWHALKPKQRQLIVAFAKAFAGKDEAGVLAAVAEQCGVKVLNEKDATVLTAKMRELWDRGEMSTEDLLETALMQGLDLAPYAISFQRGIVSFQNNLMAIQKKYAAQVQGALTDDDVAFFKRNSPVARQIGLFARHFDPMELMALVMQNPALLEFVSMN